MTLKNAIICSLSLVFLSSASCVDKSKQSENTQSNTSKVVVEMYELVADGKNKSVGTIEFSEEITTTQPVPNATPETKKLKIKTNLQLPGVARGEYGFHIHENPSCAPAEKNGKQELGLAAGDHLDPNNTHKHLGPHSSEGHLGDLPVIVVGKRGRAHNTLEAPRLTLSDVINHAVMIHAGGDNYSDLPKPLGGGGARRFCGVVPAN